MGRVRVALVVVVVLTAGCNGLAGGDSEPRRGTATLTPVPVDGTETTAGVQPATLPPGIGENGSVSVQTLLLAHRTYIDDKSYTWTLSFNRTALESGVVHEEYTKRVAVETQDRFLLEVEREGPQTDRMLYVNDSRGYLRLVQGNFTTHRFLPNPIDADGAVDAALRIEDTLAVESSNVDRIERNGRIFYRLHVRSMPETGLDGHSKSAVQNFTATAYITPEGFVRSLSVEYVLNQLSIRTRVTYRFDYTEVGRTTISEPDWATRQRAIYNGSEAYGQPTVTADETPTATPTPTPTPSEASLTTHTPVTTAGGGTATGDSDTEGTATGDRAGGNATDSTPASSPAG